VAGVISEEDEVVTGTTAGDVCCAGVEDEAGMMSEDVVGVTVGCCSCCALEWTTVVGGGWGALVVDGEGAGELGDSVDEGDGDGGRDGDGGVVGMRVELGVGNGSDVVVAALVVIPDGFCPPAEDWA
jgi:hypothetical protein